MPARSSVCRAAVTAALACLFALPAHAERVTLLGFHDLYVTADGAGQARADRPEARGWETFELVRQEHGLVSLRSVHGQYLTAEHGGVVRANRPTLSGWEQWTLVRHADGRISLRSFHGKYLMAGPDGALSANSARASGWEKFHMDPIAGGFPMLDEQARPGDTMTTGGGPQGWLVEASADWMGRLPDGVSLAHISIPGTHDSGARYGGVACATQTWSIRQQLDAGLRYLDIRARRTHHGFAIHHGACFQEIMFGDVVNQVRAFLAVHPREAIIMRVKEEHDPEAGSPSFEAIWDDYMQDHGALFARDRGYLPDLGAVRGQVFVLRDARFWGRGVEYGTADIQDKYKVYWVAHDLNGQESASLPEKKDLIAQYIDRAAGSSDLVINHLSGAVGMAPVDVARATNRSVYARLGPSAGQQGVGVLVMDYPGEWLVYRTIKTNFTSSVRCAARTWRTQSGASYAEFRMPESIAGTTITMRGGAYSNYEFPSCHRVTWTDLRFACNSTGRWSHTGSWDADAWCHDSNTSQSYLVVGDLD